MMGVTERYKRGFLRTGSNTWEKMPKTRWAACARLEALTALGNVEARRTLAVEKWNTEAEQAKKGSEKRQALIFCADVVM